MNVRIQVESGAKECNQVEHRLKLDSVHVGIVPYLPASSLHFSFVSWLPFSSQAPIVNACRSGDDWVTDSKKAYGRRNVDVMLLLYLFFFFFSHKQGSESWADICGALYLVLYC